MVMRAIFLIRQARDRLIIRPSTSSLMATVHPSRQGLVPSDNQLSRDSPPHQNRDFRDGGRERDRGPDRYPHRGYGGGYGAGGTDYLEKCVFHLYILIPLDALTPRR